MKPAPGISLIYDALLAALLHPPEAGRRHLVVGLTDGLDCGSVTDGPTLVRISQRTDAVQHVIYAHGAGAPSSKGVTNWCTPVDFSGREFVSQAAARTGGDVHAALFGDPTLRAQEDPRPTELCASIRAVRWRAGWHAVRWRCRAGDTIRARSDARRPVIASQLPWSRASSCRAGSVRIDRQRHLGAAALARRHPS
jgi:hypothetical protein